MRPSSFFTSSSSSSSTTTTTTTTASFDGSTSNPKNGSAGCFTGVLRRLLCLNSLPTHPCDHSNEEEIKSLQCVEANIASDFTAPGIVARLMGLEAPPCIVEKSPNSIGRSQSMNSIHSSTLTTLKSIQESHRRAKSFREIPSYLELEDESFFIISFENVGNGRKSNPNSGEKEQKRKATCKYKESDTVREQQNKESPDANKVSNSQKQGDLIGSQKIYSNHKIRNSSNVHKNYSEKSFVVFELVDSDHKRKGRGRRRRKKTKSEVTELETDLSPNSILDLVEFPAELDPDSPDSGSITGEASRRVKSKSRRTLSEELENYRKTEKSRLIRDDYDPKRSKDKWDEICRLVERETLQSNWIFNEILKADGFQEIGRCLAQHILDQMLAELLKNLLETSMKSFGLLGYDTDIFCPLFLGK